MILFKRDYDHLHQDHFDYSTRNDSFIKMYHVLKKMGIKNNKFFLYLHDTSLRGIDPHNLPNNSIELIGKIAAETKINPWYYFREVVRIPAAGSAEGIEFILNRANLSLIWLYFCNIDNLLIMPRQIGKTMGTLAIDSWVMFIGGFHITKTMLTKSDILRKENVARLKDIRDKLPWYLIEKNSHDINNMDDMIYFALKTKYKTFVSQLSESGAEAMGRGLTTPSQHWDEIAMFDNVHISYPSAISATNAAVESAKKFGQPYANILTTTAGKLNTVSGKYVHKLLRNSLEFTEHLYDISDNDTLREIVRNNSKQGMVYSEFSYQKLGKTDEWFNDVSSRTQGDADQIKRDYLNIWTYGTESSPIDAEKLRRVYESKKEVLYAQIIDKFLIKWYLPKNVVESSQLNEIPIVIGSDSSENIGRDFTSFVFIDARNMNVIATCRCNMANIITVALFIAEILKRPNVVIIPERNHVGAAIIDTLILELVKVNINPFFKIYNEIVQDINGKYKDVHLYERDSIDKHRKHFGFRTTGGKERGRNFLYKTVFFKALDVGGDKINDTDLINEIAGLGIRDGRIDHNEKEHDDMVIGFILASYFLFFGKNFAKYTFCDNRPEVLLRDISTSKLNVKPDYNYLIDVNSIKKELSDLNKKLSMADNPTLKIQYKMKIRELEEILPEEDVLIEDIPSLERLKETNQVKYKSEYSNDFMNTEINDMKMFFSNISM